MASTVITYAVIIFIITKIIKHFSFEVRLWFPAFLFLLFNALASFFISFVTTKPLPPSFIVRGHGIPALSLAIGAIILLLGVTTFCQRKSTEIKANKSEKKLLAWGIYALGATLVVISYYAVMASVFSPKVFNSSVPVPRFGVYIYVALSVPISVLFYLLARFTLAPSKEKYFHWQSLFAGFFCILITTLLSLMLIFATRTTPKTAYPFYSNIMTIAYLPFSLLIFSLVPRNMRRSELKTEKNV